MLATEAEIDAVQIAALCKDLPLNSADYLGKAVMDVLLEGGFLRQNRAKLCYRPAQNADSLLSYLGFDYKRDTHAISPGSLLERRLALSELVLFFYMAGADVFLRSPPAEPNRAAFLPSFLFRRKRASNLLGGTRLAGFLYSPDMTYVPYAVTAKSGIYPHEEERTFSSKLLCAGKPQAVIYTGLKDYASLFRFMKKPGAMNPRDTSVCFQEAASRFSCPVCLVPLSETGARQIRMMCSPGYRDTLARALLRRQYSPPPANWCDAVNAETGEPVYLGIDCNYKGFEAALANAERPLNIVVLGEQLAAVRQYLYGKNAVLFPFEAGTIEEILGLPHELYPTRLEPFRTKEHSCKP